MNQIVHSPLPLGPERGMVFWLQEGTHWAIGTNYSVGKINGRSFYVNSEGKTQRYRLTEWSWWLDQRLSEGRLFLHGRELTPPGHGSSRPDTARIDRGARNARVLRAARSVVKQYALQRSDGDQGDVSITLGGHPRNYQITGRVDWAVPLRCTCPDARTHADQHGGFCKHVIAACMTFDDLRCQLLDVLL